MFFLYSVAAYLRHNLPVRTKMNLEPFKVPQHLEDIVRLANELEVGIHIYISFDPIDELFAEQFEAIG